MFTLPRSLRLGIAVVSIASFAGVATAAYVTFGNGWGSKWDNPVHPNPATITWGFIPDGTVMHPSFPLAPEIVGTNNISALRAAVDGVYGAGAFNAALQRAFHTWSLVAGVTFVGPVADAGLAIGAPGATSPDIRVGAFSPAVGAGFNYVGAVGYGPPGNDLNFPDPVAGDIIFNLSATFRIFPGAEGAPFNNWGNDLEGLFLHELGHAAIGLGHPASGVSDVMYVGPGCCTLINRVPSPDDITGANVVYGPSTGVKACQNGIDDDGDGFTDLADDGCNLIQLNTENPQCDDGLDNDGDTGVDYPADTLCQGIWDNDEATNPPPSSCGILGLEALLPVLLARRLRRARRG